MNWESCIAKLAKLISSYTLHLLGHAFEWTTVLHFTFWHSLSLLPYVVHQLEGTFKPLHPPVRIIVGHVDAVEVLQEPVLLDVAVLLPHAGKHTVAANQAASFGLERKGK